MMRIFCIFLGLYSAISPLWLRPPIYHIFCLAAYNLTNVGAKAHRRETNTALEVEVKQSKSRRVRIRDIQCWAKSLNKKDAQLASYLICDAPM